MSANSSDLLKKLSRKWVGQVGAGGVSDAIVTTIPLSSATNLPTDTAVVIVIDRVSASGAKTPNLEESIIGVVSGSNLVSCIRGAEGTAQAHIAGAVVEVLFTAKGWNDLVDAILVEHSQLGVHSSALVTSLKASGATINTGTSDTTIVTPKAIADSTLPAGNGWQNAGETWTYASASTITIPAGGAAKYAVGDRIKFTQTTVKYGVIVTVADTLLTIAVNTDYVVANAAITLNYYSHEASPIGYPTWFNFNPSITFTAGTPMSGAISGVVNQFSIIGRSCHILICNVNYQGAGVNVTAAIIQAPVAAELSYQSGWGMVQVSDTPNLTTCLISGNVITLTCTNIANSSNVGRLYFNGTVYF